MLELIKNNDIIYTLETEEGRKAINEKIKETNEANKNNIFYFTPTFDDIIATYNFGEFIAKKQRIEKSFIFST